MTKFIKTRYIPKLSRLDSDAELTEGGVLILGYSEDVHLQLRRAKDFMGVTLSFDAARELADALIEATGGSK